MENRDVKSFSIILTAVCLTGCITLPQLPPELQYVMPSATATGVSTISATMIDDKVPLFDDDNTYVYAVDGQKVMLEKDHWDKPVYVLPGERAITLGFEKGAHMVFAKVSMLVAESKQYKAVSACKTGFIGNYEYCDFWIVDVSTGRAASEVTRGPYQQFANPRAL